MGDKQFVLAIIAITLTMGLLIVGVSKIAGLIKAWINRNNNSLDEEKFNRLAKAFIEYKEETQQRIQNLEAATGEEDWEPESTPSHSSEEPKQNHETIEVEDKSEDKQQSDDGGKLRNMLHE